MLLIHQVHVLVKCIIKQVFSAVGHDTITRYFFIFAWCHQAFFFYVICLCLLICIVLFSETVFFPIFPLSSLQHTEDGRTLNVDDHRNTRQQAAPAAAAVLVLAATETAAAVTAQQQRTAIVVAAAAAAVAVAAETAAAAAAAAVTETAAAAAAATAAAQQQRRFIFP